ncbi:MAG: 30S ribosomal protein S21 [Chloroflexota bacterium]
MTGVIAGENESFENLLKRFNKRVQQAGILSEIRHGEYFEKPSIKRKRKDAAKKRKSAKAVATTTTSRAPAGRVPMGRPPAR